MKRILGLSFLLSAVACAPAPRQVVLTPELLDHAPRYVLLAPQGSDSATVQEMAQVLQQELAERGMLLAAPWEAPTLQVILASRESAVPYNGGMSIIPVANRGICVDASADTGHCTPLDGPRITPQSPSMIPVVEIALQIRQIASGDVVLARRMTAGRAVSGIPIYQARYLVKEALGSFTP